MKKTITLLTIVAMLIANIASGEIKTSTDLFPGKIHRTSFQDVQVLPDTKAEVLFSSDNKTISGHAVLNYRIDITFHANSGYIASPSILYLDTKLPIIGYAIPGITAGKEGVFTSAHSSSPAGEVFQTSGIRLTPNGDGSYTADKNYDKLDKPTPADVSFSYPSGVNTYEDLKYYKTPFDVLSKLSFNEEVGRDILSAITSSHPLILTITHYPSQIDLIEKTNAKRTTIAIPAPVLQEWGEILRMNRFIK